MLSAAPRSVSVTALYCTAPAQTVEQQTSWYIYHNPSGPMSTVVLNASAQALWRAFSVPTSPEQVAGQDISERDAINKLIQTGMLYPVAQTAPLLSAASILGVWLHVTGKCNLACAYCYLADKVAETTPETLRAAIDAAFRSAIVHKYQKVHLKYSGGEPLLRLPMLLEIHRYALTHAAALGVDTDGVVLSNGTLLSGSMIDSLQVAGLQLMISLDGIGFYHDVQRRFADGRGSFEVVSRAIDLALAGGLKPIISITVSSRNSAGLPEMVAWVLERDLPFSLNFYRENDRAAKYTDLQLEEERIIAGLLAAYKVIERDLPRRSLLAALADRANFAAPHLHTCGVGEHYLVFDVQGCVSRCQMDMAHSITDCHDPDPLGTLRADKTGLQNPTVDEKGECRECQWRYWCGGGCPLIAYRTTGRYTSRSPYCNIYKAIFPEIVRLEGLRLLKYADV